MLSDTSTWHCWLILLKTLFLFDLTILVSIFPPRLCFLNNHSLASSFVQLLNVCYIKWQAVFSHLILHSSLDCFIFRWFSSNVCLQFLFSSRCLFPNSTRHFPCGFFTKHKENHYFQFKINFSCFSIQYLQVSSLTSLLVSFPNLSSTHLHKVQSFLGQLLMS